MKFPFQWFFQNYIIRTITLLSYQLCVFFNVYFVCLYCKIVCSFVYTYPELFYMWDLFISSKLVSAELFHVDGGSSLDDSWTLFVSKITACRGQWPFTHKAGARTQMNIEYHYLYGPNQTVSFSPIWYYQQSSVLSLPKQVPGFSHHEMSSEAWPEGFTTLKGELHLGKLQEYSLWTESFQTLWKRI